MQKKSWKIIRLIVYALFAVTNLIYSQEYQPSRNIDVIDSLMIECLEELSSYLQSEDINEVEITYISHPAENMLKRNLVVKFSEKGIKVYESTKTDINRVKFQFETFENIVKYENEKSSEQLNRTISVAMSVSLITLSGEIKYSPLFSKKYNDIISRKSVHILENSPFDYAKGEVPTPESSTFKKIIEPAVLIISALVTVYLLFTVRSN